MKYAKIALVVALVLIFFGYEAFVSNGINNILQFIQGLQK